MNEFISRNLRYPEEAEEAGIEGFVIVRYEVDDEGVVSHAHVQKGLGHGCDEEAVRVVSILRFEKVKNRGKRVKVTKKTRINFRLQKRVTQLNITYQIAPQGSRKEPANETPGPVTYNYTIDL